MAKLSYFERIRWLSQTPLRRKRVLLRIDANVPVAGGRVQSDFRLRAVVPTIKKLLRGGNRIILLSHAESSADTLRPASRCLARLIGVPVLFVADPWSRASAAAFAGAGPRLALIENLRRWPGEERADPGFAKKLARLGEVFVNDAFGASHRSSASLTLLPKLLPAYGGLLLERELAMLDRAIHRPARPLVAAIGGAKIETKLKLLERLLEISDLLLVGGALANALLPTAKTKRSASRNAALPKGISSKELRAIAGSPKMRLPTDFVIRRGRRIIIADFAEVHPGDALLDIGPASRRAFTAEAGKAKTVIWNGPLGASEDPAFAEGTRAFARALASHRGLVVLGGGNTIEFLERARLLKQFKTVSTGGGAMLAYLSGEKLPALEALAHM